jgi:hypothetical protein
MTDAVEAVLGRSASRFRGQVRETAGVARALSGQDAGKQPTKETLA